ncbi:MAG: AAA family ATPase, partial [Victivallales bacterium]|nr:AAA family ATPase [Victivallales bacterium]
MTIKRDLYLGKLISAKHDGFVKIITGIRRCGKSFLLAKLFRRHLIESGVPSSRIIMVDLDDDKNEHLRDPRQLSEWVRRRIRSKASR